MEPTDGRATVGRSRTLSVAIFSCVVALIGGAAAVSLVRENDPDPRVHRYSPCSEQTAKIVGQWMDAVRNRDEMRSLLLARRLAPEIDMKLPRPDYLQLFGMNGITGAFLTSGFGRVDALRWFDAAFFAKIADTLAPNPETEIRDLLEGLSRSVKMVPTTERQYPPRSLLEIWERGYGNAADRVRVFAELCRQKGYETWLVQFRNADNGDVLAQYCELRRDGWKTVIDVAGGREIGDVAWNHLESSLRRDSGRVVTQILAMAEAADYRSANQRLADLLKQVGQSDSTRPAFGLDPFNAIQAYLDRSGGRRSESIGYWQIPLIALHPRKEEAAP